MICIDEKMPRCCGECFAVMENREDNGYFCGVEAIYRDEIVEIKREELWADTRPAYCGLRGDDAVERDDI